MRVTIPEPFAVACGSDAQRLAWLDRLPTVISELARRWRLEVGAPFEGRDVSCSWVARVQRDGRAAVLKLGMPHMEGMHELQGLRFWNGDPTVMLLEADSDDNAMLLEACDPGQPLRGLPEPEQDVVIAAILHGLWRRPAPGHPFRPLSAQTAYWIAEASRDRLRWPDAGLVREGLTLLEHLSSASPDDVLLATDLHAGNILSATRQPWLVIDPKPFVGDRAYDATQHLLNCPGRLRADPRGTVRQFADRLAVEADRVRLWLMARLAAEPRGSWSDESLRLARSMA